MLRPAGLDFVGSNVDSEPGLTHAQGQLLGWAGIEHHMVKHDSGMVKDYADDIDTLLVFAGLFSAVVTAFVVETYGSLQPDPTFTTNQLLAHGLSSQLAHSSSSSDFNSTISSILSPRPFVPPMSARWINSLFFVSLVLSLSAAFFGILAKQWLREYMHWHSTMDPSRQNVLVRQARFEAWETWNVAATMSVIPAFLELAMILYLIGIVILLWTLDDVVAIIISVVVAAFLATASAFTILPLLCKRCPYKSPTAWAIFTAWTLICATRRYSRRVWKASKGSHLYALPLWRRVQFAVQSVDWPVRYRNWRERDLDGCRPSPVNGWQGDSETAWKVARLELAKEQGHLTPDGCLVWPRSPPHQNIQRAAKHVSQSAAYMFMTDLSETSLLWRALAWMRKTSQDVRVSTYIDQSIGTIHHNSQAFGVSHGSHTLTDWCIISSLASGCPIDPLKHLLLNDGSERPTRLRKALRVQGVCFTERPTSFSVGHFVFSVNDRPSLTARLGLLQSGPELYILLRVISTDLQSLMEHLQAMVDTQEVTARSEDFSIHVRRVFELTSALLRLASYGESSFLGGPQYTAGLYAIISCKGQMKKELESLAPGLRLVAFRLACRYAKVSAHRVGDEIVLAISDGTMGHSDYESLLLDYFNYDLRQCSEDDIDLFVAATIAWLSIESRTTDPSEAAVRILDKISGTVQALNEQRGRKRNHSCLNSDSDWLEALSYDFRWRQGSFWSSYKPLARQIFHHFETLHSEGLLTGDVNELAANLHTCLERSHEHVQICEVQECRWTSHICDLATSSCQLLVVSNRDSDSIDPTAASNFVLEKGLPLQQFMLPLASHTTSHIGRSSVLDVTTNAMTLTADNDSPV